jgi:nitrilase
MRVAAVQNGVRRRRRGKPRERCAAHRRGGGGGRESRRFAEYFGIFGLRATDKVTAREADGDGPQQAFLSRLARQHAIWLVGGTVPIASGDPARVRSALVVYGPDGKRIARYDKIHLFAFTRGDERYDEGKTIERAATCDDRAAVRARGLVDLLRRALSELYRRMGLCR